VRSLIYVPMVHSEADLGRMAEEIRAQYTETFGREAWTRRSGAVDAMWNGIRARLLALPLEWPRVRLYQDGLPICGREEDIVRDVAAAGSPNHALLLELMARGAKLMGTEDPALLLREYRRVQALVLAAPGGASPASIEAIERDGRAALHERDAFMAQRIAATLEPDETGIVFLGLLHRVDELMPPGIEQQHVIHNLPFGADSWRRLEETSNHGG
jgi:hypothetical protein